MIRNVPTVLAALALFATNVSAEETAYEPVPVYVFENTFTEPGKPPKTVTEEYVGVSPFRVKDAVTPPQGYTEAKLKEEITVGGKNFAAEKSVWTRDSRVGYPNHGFATVTCWKADSLKSGLFALPLNHEPDLAIPAGCLRLETGPAAPGEKDASEIKLEWKCEIGFSTTEAEFKAQQYEFSVKKGDDGMKGTYLVAPEIDGGICGLSCEATGRRSGSGSQTLKSIRTLKAPAGILPFPDAGFGFARPDGYTPEKAGAREFAAFRNASGATIRISAFDLHEQEFKAWWKARPENKDASGRGESYVAMSVTGCTSAFSESAKSGAMDFYFGHNGWGYKVSISNGTQLRDSEIRKLVAGWRWIKK